MHHLNVFRIPLTISDKIDAMIAKFFCTNQHGQGIHRREKYILHQPRGMGGLGILSISAMNEALLMMKV